MRPVVAFSIAPTGPPSRLSDHALCGWGLTPREAEVLRCVACGESNGEVAGELHISAATVKKHLEHIYAKLAVGSRGAAVAQVLALDRRSAAGGEGHVMPP